MNAPTRTHPRSTLPGRFRPLLAETDRFLQREWAWLVFVAWAIIASIYLARYAPQMHYMSLGDTDDNMRYLQVRDWLAGQSWWDLTQHRMDPPHGANIHWSRLVDLPIAALMLVLRPLFGEARGDQLALGVAPLLPLLPQMLAVGFVARRLSNGGHGWAVAALLPLGANIALAMFMPMRVDHHGWQLALTTIALAGLVDRKWMRGGLVCGMASALSVAIGMEMMVYLAGSGALIGLRWVFKPGAARRMVPYALALGGTTAVCYVFFTSNANRAEVCDALSPVWATLLTLASGLMLLLAMLPLRSWPARLGAAAIGGVLLLGYAHALWPQCLTGAYQISPELDHKWLTYIREAKSITEQKQSIWLPMIALPVAGLISSLAAMWAVRRDSERLWAWATVALMILFAAGLMFWQIRTAPAAQLLALAPLGWAGWSLFVALWRGPLWRRGAALGGIALIAGVANASPLYPTIAPWLPGAKPAKPAATARKPRKPDPTGLCRTQPALAALNQLPPALIFTMVDLGPRIIALTHHSVIAGPYHRNGRAILDIHHAMDGPADSFRPIAARHGATYLLICPGFAEGTIYQARSPQGFYANLIRGRVPDWLRPVTLRSGYTLPYTLYRIDYRRAAKKVDRSIAASPAPKPA